MWWDQTGTLAWEPDFIGGANNLGEVWTIMPKDLTKTPEEVQALLMAEYRHKYDNTKYGARYSGYSFDRYVSSGWAYDDFQANRGSHKGPVYMSTGGVELRQQYRDYHKGVYEGEQQRQQQEAAQAEQRRQQEAARKEAEKAQAEAEARRKEAEAAAKAQREATQRQTNLGTASRTVANQGTLDRPLVLKGGGSLRSTDSLGIGRGGGKRFGGSRLSKVLGFK